MDKEQRNAFMSVLRQAYESQDVDVPTIRKAARLAVEANEPADTFHLEIRRCPRPGSRGGVTFVVTMLGQGCCIHDRHIEVTVWIPEKENS